MDIPAGEILLGAGEDGAPVTLRLDRANRHGLVAGATGTGKTVTLQVMAEAFSRAGTPVFCADVKGDLSGISRPAQPSDKLAARAQAVGVTLQPAPCPVIFWDLFGAEGHPVRATVSDLGPVLLARLLQLSDVQTGVLNVVFHVADQEGLLLLDLDDLQAALQHVAENSKTYGAQYGNVAPASVRVNSIAPGPTDTAVFDKLGAPPEAIEGIKASFVKQVPLGRIATSDEVAKWIVALSAPSVTWITGQVLSVDGGMSL